MDFRLTDEQRMVAETARGFADRELAPRAAERDRTSRFPEAELAALARLGLLGVNVPEALGGAEAGAVAYSLAMQEVAGADASVSVAMAVTNMVAEVVVRFGTDEQKQRHVPRLTSGEYIAGAFALSEPQAGSDPSAMTTTATRTANGYRLDGAKQWITSGDRAGLIVVWAKTDPKAGARGISAFL
ncbi:MAG: acyl-CoA dehydrogenase, partial [Myxococcales bacterium]|nr:acyl-CoA dehydrogenase [Myxococcales bacterium]